MEQIVTKTIIETDDFSINKCQITLCLRLSLRYTQTNYKTKDEFDINDLTFNIRYDSLSQDKGKNVYNIKVDKYGWRKAYIIAINLAFVANVCGQSKVKLTDDQMKEYEKLSATVLLKNMNEFIDFPLLPERIKHKILIKYSKNGKKVVTGT